jgi:hypothetical protein
MRTSALLSSILVLATVTVAGSAHADTEYRYHARTHEVAAAESTHAYSATQTASANAAQTPALGAMAITGKIHAAHADSAEAGIQAASDPFARREPFLSNGDIKSTIAPYSQELESCYLDHGGHGGKLEVTVVISRDGHLTSLKADAQGVSPKATHKIESCLKEIGETVQFPERRSETTAVLPWLFQKTSAPGAGPALSCWNAKGC